ncbi:MAG: anthranilate synthase component I family protein [Spirochaetia bacterium]|nr:anthranilate synthase component I family protein [Spirochaetia bacterium]
MKTHNKILEKLDLPKKPVYKNIDPGIDFLSLFRLVEQRFDTVFLLESLGEDTYDSRYSVIGFSPDSIIRGRKKQLFIDDVKYSVKNPYYALRDLIPQDVISRQYGGGLVGYLGYDAFNYFEPSMKLRNHPQWDSMLFGLYTDGLVYDKFTGQTFYFYYKNDRSSMILELAKESPQKLKPPNVREISESLSREDHRKMVEEAIEEIRAGNTFQCQIGFKKEFKITGDAFQIYQSLRVINPSPHMFYMKFKDRKMIGASPELNFRLRQGEMESFPLAGTTRRGKTAQEDTELVRKLLNDPKEIAEHNMLIDLHRNDIGRVARFGTVKVRRQFDIKRFSHVQHISSEVVGIISEKHDMFSGLASSFPAGTLSGAPKIESMKIIDRIEQSPRGPYGGAVGHFGFNGDCTFSIPIRTLFINGSSAFLRASGGIVYDSVPENEYQEILNKMGAVLASLKEFMKEE